MNTLTILLIIGAVVAVALGTFLFLRRSKGKSELRDMGKGLRRGARDASNKAHDAAEDTADAIKDASK